MRYIKVKLEVFKGDFEEFFSAESCKSATNIAGKWRYCHFGKPIVLYVVEKLLRFVEFVYITTLFLEVRDDISE